MITKENIEYNLAQINRLYNKSRAPRHALYFPKLATLELCGWIEESMDDIVQWCSDNYLFDPNNIDFVKSQVIKRTYGFDYNSDFRNMLMRVIGIINLEQLENNLDNNKFLAMKSSLDTLKGCRDSEAHTYTKGVTMTVLAPSVAIQLFRNVYLGLKEVEKCLFELYAQ